MQSILNLFPEEMRNLMKKTAEYGDRLQEIRLRADREVLIYVSGEEWYLDRFGEWTKDRRKAVRMSQEELGRLISYSCSGSIYAYEDDICRGYLTLPGGHRLGLTGKTVTDENGGVRSIRHYSGINIRIAHQIRGVADQIMGDLYQNGHFQNTLIVSPPCCGKTTLLRDIVRQISDGNRFSQGMTVGVVDERSEIAGSFQGRAQNDVGRRTDILDACPKEIGMMMLIRSMSPAVIAVDELGGDAEVEAVKKILQCGCSILATAHGFSAEEAADRLKLPFQRYIVMHKENGECKVKDVLYKVPERTGGRVC